MSTATKCWPQPRRSATRATACGRCSRATSKPPSILVQLLRASDDPLVAPVLARVAERRLAVLARAYRETGMPRARAEHEALLAYTSYLGRAFAPEDRVRQAYARHLAGRLVP